MDLVHDVSILIEAPSNISKVEFGLSLISSTGGFTVIVFPELTFSKTAKGGRLSLSLTSISTGPGPV